MGLEGRTPGTQRRPLMATCLRCRGWVADDLTADHIRLIHPDQWPDAEPQRWPDGRPVWVDLTLDPDDFKEDA